MITKSRELRQAEYQRNRENYLKTNSVWRDNNRALHNHLSRQWYHQDKTDNPLKYLLKKALYRANKKNLEFDITAQDLTLPEVCPIFKRPFIYNDYDWTYSLDRKDNARGYTKENTWVISALANRMKSSASTQELKEFCKGILELDKC